MNLKSYCVGILEGATMTQCTLMTSELAEAKKKAINEYKNVYELIDGFFYLKFIGVKW